MPTTSDTPPRGLGTQALCTAAGVTRGMLRLYEREGLIPPPRRSAAGYRHYPATEVQRLQAIKSLKEIGFTLKEIALLLDEQGSGDLDLPRLQELAQEQLAVIDTRIARLTMVRGYMAAVADGNLALITDPECNFLIDFLSAGQRPAPDAASTPHAPPAAGRRQPAAPTAQRG